jgi:hypothetical protein
MINVGIAGSFKAINRHRNALHKLRDIRIAGAWCINGSQNDIVDLATGMACYDSETILEKIDALIITDPGVFFNQLPTLALRKAKHVFLYPSVITSINEAYQLIKLAREANVILKCGRTGKFSIQGLLKSIPDSGSISMIEMQHVLEISKTGRTPQFPDIMLGDIEIIGRLIKARNTSIKAKGICIISSQPEIINARLEFDNGSAVNYYCNIIGMQNEHHITLMMKDSIMKYNLLSNELSGWYLKRNLSQHENPIFIENIQVEQPDNLVDDLYFFFNLIHSGPAFLSIYDSGFESFVLTDRILEKISKTLVQFA